ncbi:MAG: 16S rRNA (guanine(966)-N(2))-methyltransferase RsmD [Alphaproteobacteria bacterium]|nr:16S rRNA (guanine(966)-N(2))-methyltransferase RsmD [Alphaproteobacteria bacterium]
MTMHIITGKHRGARLETLDSKQLRPTMGKVREALFNILCHGPMLAPNYLEGLDILDIFCGCGSLGFEALSRGAKSVTFIDRSREALDIVKKNAKHLREEETCQFVCTDSSRLPSAKQAYHLAFIDAPYDQKLTLPCLTSLAKGGWLNQNALICVEVSKTEDLVFPQGYVLDDERHYGRTKLVFLRYSS